MKSIHQVKYSKGQIGSLHMNLTTMKTINFILNIYASKMYVFVFIKERNIFMLLLYGIIDKQGRVLGDRKCIFFKWNLILICRWTEYVLKCK